MWVFSFCIKWLSSTLEYAFEIKNFITVGVLLLEINYVAKKFRARSISMFSGRHFCTLDSSLNKSRSFAVKLKIIFFWLSMLWWGRGFHHLKLDFLWSVRQFCVTYLELCWAHTIFRRSLSSVVKNIYSDPLVAFVTISVEVHFLLSKLLHQLARWEPIMLWERDLFGFITLTWLFPRMSSSTMTLLNLWTSGWLAGWMRNLF